MSTPAPAHLRPLETEAAPPRRSLFSQIAHFGVASLLVAASTVLLVKLYALRFSAAEVSAFLVFRPYGALLVALGTFGLPIGLRRTVAMLDHEPRRLTTVSVIGLTLGVGLMAIVGLAAAGFAGQVTRGIDAPDAVALWRGFLWMTVAQALVTLAISIEMGTGRTMLVSAAMVHAFALAPMISFFALPGAPFSMVLWMSGHLALLACAPTVFTVVRMSAAHGFGAAGTEAAALARYCTPRVIANAIEWSVEPMVLWLALRLAGFAGGAGLAVGITLLRLLNPLSVALNQAVVPAAARLSAAGDQAGERRQVFALVEWAIGMGAFATAALVVWCDVLVARWLGSDFLNAVPIARLLALAIAPSLIYLSLRGVIDGQTEKAVNAQNLAVSLVSTLVLGAALSQWLEPALGLAVGYLLGRWVLAGLALRYQIRTERLRLSEIPIVAPIAAATMLGGAMWAVRVALPGANDVLMLGSSLAVAATVYLLMMLRQGARWASTLARAIWPHHPQRVET